MHSDDFIRNAWYVAARSGDIGQRLTPVRLLDEPIVLFRGSAGEPIALEDACPHRKLPLSKGNLKGSTVECGYHGLTFDGTGACVAAPTQAAGPMRNNIKQNPRIAFPNQYKFCKSPSVGCRYRHV